MLIPHGDGKWSWNDGPICDSQEEALKTASIPVSDETVTTCIVDMREAMELDDE